MILCLLLGSAVLLIASVVIAAFIVAKQAEERAQKFDQMLLRYEAGKGWMRQ